MDENLYNQWKDLYDKAFVYTKQLQVSNGILIEVAAQHPLVDKKYPNTEFTKRLAMAAEKYIIGTHQGYKVAIYVPGSKHICNEIEDDISLSEAGIKYLIDHDVDKRHIYGDAENDKYTCGHGVYCTEDECFVATQLFKDLNFGKLVSICSPAQLMRKQFAYIKYGIIAEMYSAPCKYMFHNYVDEYFKEIPAFLENDINHLNAIRTSRQPKRHQ